MNRISTIGLVGFVLLLLNAPTGWGQNMATVNWKKVKVLVYTKNGKGYVHDNIPNAVACIQHLGRRIRSANSFHGR